MAEQESGDWRAMQGAAWRRVAKAEEGGYEPTAIDAAMARGNFHVGPNGGADIYFASMPPASPRRPEAASTPPDDFASLRRPLGGVGLNQAQSPER